MSLWLTVPFAYASTPDFVDALNQRVQTLVDHPRIEVRAAYFGPPITHAELAAFEVRLGRPVPARLRAVFAKAKDIQVVRRCLPKGETHTIRPPNVRFDDGPDLNNRDVHGAIELSTLQYMANPEPEDHETIDGKATHRRHFRPIDMRDYYHATALVVDPAFPEIRVLDFDDYWAHVDPVSRSVDDFLALLVSNVGYTGDRGDDLCKDIENELGLTLPGRPRRPDPSPKP